MPCIYILQHLLPSLINPLDSTRSILLLLVTSYYKKKTITRKRSYIYSLSHDPYVPIMEQGLAELEREREMRNKATLDVNRYCVHVGERLTRGEHGATVR